MTAILANRKFSSLSVKDLLDAREAYHTHLVHLENVIATAIGRYRFTAEDVSGAGARGRDNPRTLANSEVRDASWPCVLVFVDAWIPTAQLAYKFDDIVPPRLYLPDGRVVPTCVILADKRPARPRDLDTLRFPDSLLGGGYPSIADVQQQTRVATIGCLVSDGDRYYALTNAHVAGTAGRPLYTLVRGRRELLGHSVPGKALGKMPFETAYPGFAGPRTLLTVDAALIQIDDATRWTSQVYGIGELDEVADLNVDTYSLDLIGCPLVAFGAASGEMRGEVQGLFYRYSSVGGQDQVADLLIGPRAGAADLGHELGRHGNSGALWFLDQSTPARRKLRPIALHWGSQRFVGGGDQSATQYALATSLGVVQRELGVELVRDVNIGLPQTWGKTGHYKVAQLACRLDTAAGLGKLLERNLPRISYREDVTHDSANPSAQDDFIPLADVPDLAWKRGGRSVRGSEGPNHFADMDQASSANETLLQLSEDPAFVDPEKWSAFYEALDIDVNHRGLLPFRVWQLFDAMVAAARGGDVARYVAAAGVLAHYVGDACQPLHVSMYHDGDPATGRGEGVHGAYETKMLDSFAIELNQRIDAALAASPPNTDGKIASGLAAAQATIQLMARSIRAIPPLELIECYEHNDHRVKALFDAYGDKTVLRLIDGATTLASLWRGAWELGKGSEIADSHLRAVPQTRLADLYLEKTWVPSVTIVHMTRDGERLEISSDRVGGTSRRAAQPEP